jgi:hypothetical protein
MEELNYEEEIMDLIKGEQKETFADRMKALISQYTTEEIKKGRTDAEVSKEWFELYRMFCMLYRRDFVLMKMPPEIIKIELPEKKPIEIKDEKK